MYETKPYFYGTGRRKDSVARVRVYAGTGKITINDRDLDNYFGLETLKLIVRAPLVLLGVEDKFDVVVRVAGGGISGQAGAIRHGISRAMLQQNEENRAVLKKAGYLTRDPRMKERKKYGLPPVQQALIFPTFQYVSRRRFAGKFSAFGAVRGPRKCSVLLRKEQAGSTQGTRSASENKSLMKQEIVPQGAHLLLFCAARLFFLPFRSC